MTKQSNKPLTARTLDVVITKITAKTVYYDLTANRQGEQWRIPSTSTFDVSQLRLNTRYQVQTEVIRALEWSYAAQNRIRVDRFDWKSVNEVQPKAKLKAKSAKQRELSESLANTPLVDNGELFRWRRND